MSIRKKVLLTLFLGLFLFLLPGCGNTTKHSGTDSSAADFPRDRQGYPKSNVVIINGTEYSIKNLSESADGTKIDQEIHLSGIQGGDSIEVILPQYLPVNLWSMEERQTIDLTGYAKAELDVKKTLEGISACVQTFTFTVENDDTVLFQWSNIEESGKAFSEKEYAYLLKIHMN